MQATRSAAAVPLGAFAAAEQDADRIMIFSDQHKGARDGADDFQRCERAYNAALAWYDDLGYRLIVLGDVEELWENVFQEVSDSYAKTLALEAAFHSKGRYSRVWGNHDIVWKDPESFKESMAALGLEGVEPIESMRLRWTRTDDSYGELFLVHGHQGTAESELFAGVSQFAVKRGWRRVQRLLNRPWNTPSVDWSLRGEHARLMSEWAAERRCVLIAGHTHLPVFFNERKEPATTPKDAPSDAVRAIEFPDPELEKSLEMDKAPEALKRARACWEEAEQKRLEHQTPIDLTTPCYFNTGCCSFGDGDITGLAISGESIRLVRWPCEPGVAPDYLANMKLEDIMRQVVAPLEK